MTDDASYTNKTVSNFQTFKNIYDDWMTAKSLTSTRLATNTLANQSTNNDVLEVDTTEFVNDMNMYTLPEETLADVINTDMQIIVADTLYQFTRIGLFKTQLEYLPDYTTFFNTNKNQILYDANYVAVPGEVSIDGNQFQVQPGTVRQSDATNDILSVALTYLDDGGGYGGSGGGNPGVGGTPDYYVNTTMDKFDKEYGITFDDWAKRRFVFKTQNISINLFGWGFNKIDIKAKVQRQKRFLFINYWGPSYADEIIVGCDNMNLETDYIFPTPQNFTTLSKPTFEGLADFEVGNWVLKTFNVKVNISALGYTLTNSQVSSFINSQFNSVVGQVYNNAFQSIERNLITSIDPSYVSIFEAYTKKFNSLNGDNKLKWVIGKAEKPQGYSHENTWRFDWNIGGTIVSQNGGVGGYPLEYNYKYDMKGGSFFGRARVGNIWHGIRIVKI